MSRFGAFLMAFALVGCAAVAAAGETNIPNSLGDAKVGEWALYSIPNGYQQKHTVVKIEGSGPEATVTVRVDNLYNGEVVSSTDTFHEAGDMQNPGITRADFDGDIEVKQTDLAIKGKKIHAYVVDVEKEDGEKMEWYLSLDVPVFGMIKQFSDGDLEYDLIDFGDN